SRSRRRAPPCVGRASRPGTRGTLGHATGRAWRREARRAGGRTAASRSWRGPARRRSRRAPCVTVARVGGTVEPCGPDRSRRRGGDPRDHTGAGHDRGRLRCTRQRNRWVTRSRSRAGPRARHPVRGRMHGRMDATHRRNAGFRRRRRWVGRTHVAKATTTATNDATDNARLFLLFVVVLRLVRIGVVWLIGLVRRKRRPEASVHSLPQVFPDLEERQPLFGDVNSLAGSRVATLIGLVLADSEATEAADLDTF